MVSSSCPAANACFALGGYPDKSGQNLGVIEAQNKKGNWSATKAPEPSDAGRGSERGFWFGTADCKAGDCYYVACPTGTNCQALSCPTTTMCLAVGSYTDSSGYLQPAIDTMSDGSWSSEKAALPKNAAADSVGTGSGLYSVSCTSTTSCVAVGWYTDSGGLKVALIDRLSGTDWSATAAPAPTGVTPDVSVLDDVSCSVTPACIAGGNYQSAPGVGGPLVTFVSAGGTPTSFAAPLPTDASSTDQYASPAQVICPAASLCLSVGYYDLTGGDGGQSGLIDSWNGKSWSGTAAPAPTDSDVGNVSAISCGSAKSCVAIGHTFGSGGDAVLETLAHGKWTGRVAPVPPGAATGGGAYSFLLGISCPTASACTGVGEYYEPMSTTAAMTDTLAGDVWSSAATPVPGNVSQSQGFVAGGDTVSCVPPSGACLIAGTYVDDDGFDQGFLDTVAGG